METGHRFRFRQDMVQRKPHFPSLLSSTLYISRWEAKRSALLKRLSEAFWRTRKAHQRVLSGLMSESVTFSDIIETW